MLIKAQVDIHLHFYGIIFLYNDKNVDKMETKERRVIS